MAYLQTHNRNGRSYTRLIIGIVSAIIIIFGGIEWLAPHFLPAIFTTIARPFWRIEFSVTSGSLRSPEALLSENEELKRELADISIRSQATALLEQENADLKGLFNRTPSSTSSSVTTSSASISTSTSSSTFSTTSSVIALPLILKPSHLTLAAILVRPPHTLYDELVVDIGADHGLVAGDLVYAPGTVLIGRVVDVMSDTSKVSLLSSSGSSFDVLVGSKSIPAKAVGRGGGQYSAELPRDTMVTVGDIVTAPSLYTTTVGIVGAVVSDPSQAFQTILFAPPSNLYETKWVLIDTKSKI